MSSALSTAAPPGAITVVLVEDNPGDARLILETLRDVDAAEFTLEQFDRLAPALDRLGRAGVDVVLLDLGLPDSSGLDTFTRAQRAAPNEPIVVISGLDDERMALEAVKAGAQDYVVKGRVEGQLLARVLRYAIERKRAERALRVQKSRFRALVEHSWDGVAVLASDGTIQYASPATSRVLGYAPEGLVGRNAFELMRPDCHGHVRERLAESLRRPREQVAVEAAVRHHDGSWRILEGVFTNLTLDPAVRGIVTNFRDVTERRRSDQLIRWLSLAVDQGPTSVIMTDVNGNIEYVNAKFTQVTGYRFDEVRGRNPRMLQSGETSRELYQELWSTISAGSPWHGEILNRRKDGSENWDSMWIYPIREGDGPITHFLALKEDITERRRADEARRASDLRLRTLLETVNLIVLGLDRDGRVDYVNPYFLRMTGYSLDDVVGRDWFESFVPAAERPPLRVAFHELLAAGHHLHHQNKIVTRSGEERMISWNNTVLRGPTGEPIGTLSIAQDITDQQRLEEQLRQAQKMEAVGRLAGGVAHDFNNVLTAILGYADLLTLDRAPDDPVSEDVGEIRKAATRAAGLTRQLLAFSRRQVLQPAVLSINAVVDNLEKMLRRLIGEDVDLATRLDGGIGNVLADPGQLEQVLMNLAVNARDAMPTGGKLTIETANAELGDEYTESHQPVLPGQYVLLAVTDTGIGMDRQTQLQIFEPFFTTKEKGKGTGLGLSTVYGIVKQSGGYIWVYSEPGRGATFKIYLPRVDATAEHPTPTAQPDGTLTGTETVLLAEDDELLRPLIRGILNRLGYRVLEADNAQAALALARSHPDPIHLLVTDVVMPGESGRELARHLASIRPDTRVLYISGYTDDAIVRHGMLEPGLHYLQKPFTPAALARKVREVLEGPP